jgi:hypothetical protein
MQENIILPNFLNPYISEDLTRIGKPNDGGYIVSSQDVENTKNLISLGISFDYSFEEKFLEKNKKINIRTYDGSVGFKYYFKKCKYRIKLFTSKPNKKNFLNVVDGLNSFVKFGIFFRFNLSNKIKHVEKFVTSDTSLFKEFEMGYGYKPKTIKFTDVISNNLTNVFLSIDIEGGEYDLLDDISKFSKNLTGLNIEFHSVERNLEKIQTFIKKFDLLLIHTHVNNFGQIINGTPSVIELSFSNQLKLHRIENLTQVNKLPINKDQPNNPEGIDYLVTFN